MLQGETNLCCVFKTVKKLPFSHLHNYLKFEKPRNLNFVLQLFLDISSAVYTFFLESGTKEVEVFKIMSFISTLTWSCIKLQNFIEDPNVKEQEKKDLILKHLNSMEEGSSRDVFPEFESGMSLMFLLKTCNLLNSHNYFRLGMV
jgi:hypothetical protein